MKKFVLVIAIALGAPLAAAQVGQGTNIATGTQSNAQDGVANVGVNQGSADQTANVAVTPGGPSKPNNRNDAMIEGTLNEMFGPGPLVENNMVVGTQMNQQAGTGNVASNSFDADQSAAGAGGGGAGVANNVAVGTQYNVQTGNNNVGVNQGRINQRAVGVTNGPAAGLVSNNVAVAAQVNVQQGDNNLAVNDLDVDQSSQIQGQ